MDKRFRVVMVPVKGDEEFAMAMAPNPDAALGLGLAVGRDGQRSGIRVD
jgi:hypothetical protein